MLIIHPALAPYRIDLFNRLSEHLDLRIVFQRRQVRYHADLRQQSLRSALRCRHDDLGGNMSIGRWDFPWGILPLLFKSRPTVVVTSEFSFASLLVVFVRLLFGFSLRHVIWTDLNLATISMPGRLRHIVRTVCARRAHAIVACSPAVKDAIAARYGIPAGRISQCAVHQAPETVRARLAGARDAAARHLERHRLRDARIVLFVGRLAPEKNLELFLSAFARARHAEDTARLVFVGSGPEASALQGEAKRLGLADRMVFAGHCEGEELYAWYRIAGLVVLPSTFEPYGAVINEALLCGVPVLCSSASGVAWTIREGRDGHVLPADREDAWVSALERMLPDLVTGIEASRHERPDRMSIRFDDDVAGFRNGVAIAQTPRAASGI